MIEHKMIIQDESNKSRTEMNENQTTDEQEQKTGNEFE